MTEAIPQASPGAAVQERRSEYLAAGARVLDSGTFILGAEVAAFEAEFATWVGRAHAVGVANGTDAIEIALRALGINAGDGVITVSHTAGASIAGILRAGAVPVLVDVDYDTMTIDPRAVEAVLETPPTGVQIRGLLAVHLYGDMADMPRLMALATAAELAVVEDCAQAHGATLDGVPAGRWGHAAAFSFYPTKNLGAVGDAGIVVTQETGAAAAARQLREYGWRRRQYSEGPGANSRLDELQAAFLRVGLGYLDEDNARRRAIADAYDEGLRGTQVRLSSRIPGHEPAFHQYVIRTRERDRLRNHCEANGIGTAVHYPVPAHLQPGFERRTVRGSDLAVTERLAGEILSLPMFPQLRVDQVGRVIEVVGSWVPARG